MLRFRIEGLRVSRVAGVLPVLGMGTMVGLIGNHISPILTEMPRLLGVNMAGSTYIVTSWMLAHAISQVVAGPLIDRLGYRSVFNASVVLMVLYNILMARASTLGTILGLRLLAGVATGCGFMSGIDCAVSWGSDRWAVVARGVYGATINVGAALAFVVVPRTLVALGWLPTFVIQGVLGSFILVAANLPAAACAPGPRTEGVRQPSLPFTRRVLAQGLVHFGCYGASTTVTSWGTSILAQASNMNLLAGSTIMAASVAAGILGRVASGLLLKQCRPSKIRAVCTATVTILSFFLSLRAGSPAVVVTAGFLILASNLTFASVFTDSPVKRQIGRGAFLGYVSFLGNVGSFSLSAIVGLVSYRTGDLHQGIRTMACCLVLVTLGVLGLAYWDREGKDGTEAIGTAKLEG